MKKKAIVIGLDGLEPTIVEAMMERGELPAFSRLRRAGHYSRLATTYPAQTPVAWSSFSTGTNPGGHGVFDFVSRDPATYLPDFALTRFEKPKNMFSLPRVRNQRRGVPFWQVLNAAGVPATVLRCPCTFPPDELRGKMISGVGVPDLRGSQGTGTFYTQQQDAKAQENEQLVVLPAAGDSFETHLIGPRNTRANPPEDTRAEIRVEVDHAAGRMRVGTGGEPATVELARGEWSPWVRVKFKFSMLQAAAGQVRFFLRALSPHLEFYVSPVNFDPAAPLFPVSAPQDYARELAGEIGAFSTLGMAEDHTALNNGRIDEAAYLAQCALVLAERERMMDHEFARFTEGLFFIVFDTPDRVQHMFWRFRDPQHPFHEPDRAPEFIRQIEEHYRHYDGVLARVMEHADEQTLLVVLSDHGFGTFRRAVHINTWLWREGLLALHGAHKPDEELGDGFTQVDWSKTRAYALGLAGIYLNRKGREREGIVDDDGDADRVRRAIVAGLAGLPDPASGRVAIHSVGRAEELYSGAYAAEAPDLLVNYAPGYRVSWQTALGGMPRALFEDNLRRWSGDHIIDPQAVPGILLMNRAAAPAAAPPDIRDLAPTILAHFGVAPHPAMEGQSLL
ncbi:MAG TPA: alkaline phosphatase family protein [Candidatus Acidoferrales bacterium]|nr:alkaline phosphatase family protein [Candidatus Acidoferrales bacterium]